MMQTKAWSKTDTNKINAFIEGTNRPIYFTCSTDSTLSTFEHWTSSVFEWISMCFFSFVQEEKFFIHC